MVPVEIRQQPHVSFTQLDQYLRCPLRYRFLYIDRLEPDFVPAARAFGSGIHAAAAVFFRGVGQGERPAVEDVQGYFETFWKLETEHQPLRYGEKESRESCSTSPGGCSPCCARSSGRGPRSSLSSSRSRCRSSTR